MSTVDPTTAKRLARHRDNVRKAVELRDDAIRQAVEAGGSYRQVAELVDLSHQTVANIVRRSR